MFLVPNLDVDLLRGTIGQTFLRCIRYRFGL